MRSARPRVRASRPRESMQCRSTNHAAECSCSQLPAQLVARKRFGSILGSSLFSGHRFPLFLLTALFVDCLFVVPALSVDCTRSWLKLLLADSLQKKTYEDPVVRGGQVLPRFTHPAVSPDREGR